VSCWCWCCIRKERLRQDMTMSVPVFACLSREQPRTCQIVCGPSTSHRSHCRVSSLEFDPVETGRGRSCVRTPFAWCGVLSWLVAVLIGTRAAVSRRLDVWKSSSDRLGLAYAASRSPRASSTSATATVANVGIAGAGAPTSALAATSALKSSPAGPAAAVLTAAVWMRSRLTILLVLVPCTLGGWLLVEGLREFEKRKPVWRTASPDVATRDQGNQ
jgi:hypothetical protein